MITNFTKDTSITFITRVLQIILGIGSSIIITRILKPEGKGIYSLAILFPTLLISLINVGIGPASVFYIGRKKYSSKEVFGVNIIYSILISIFGILVGLVVIFFFSNKIFPGVAKEYLLLALLLIPFQVFLTFTVNILLGLQKIRKYSFIQLIQTLIFLVCVAILLLGFRLGIKAAIIAQILSLIIACIILFFQTRQETKGLVLSLNKNLLKDFFSYGIKVYFGNILSFLHYRIDMFMLNIFLNSIAVGFYSVAVVLSEKIWLISGSAGTVLFPQVSSETNKRNLNKFTPLVCRNVLFVTILFAVFLFVIGRWLIISLYSEQFSDAVLPFQILLIGAVTISGWRILANDLYGRGKPLLNSYITAVSVVTNIILNIILIPRSGITGAAWATSISYTIALILVVIIYSKISGNKITGIILIKKADFRYYRGFINLVRIKYFDKNVT